MAGGGEAGRDDQPTGGAIVGEYRALYRAWRPRRFADVVGQEHVTRTLRNALAGGRLGHAYLFCGPRGTGKTSVARILAQAANCTDLRDGEPCGACANCAAVAADRFLDLQEIDGASSRGIDEVRGLREDARYAAIAGRVKVYIIDEVHMLTEPAWNALLKTLEEPPAGTLFILATTDPRKVPLTALSRCQRFDFRRLAAEEIAARLAFIAEREGLAVAPEALAEVARRADGGLRDALSLLDQAVAYAGERVTLADVLALSGAADEEALRSTLAAVAAGDAPAALAQVEQFYTTGRDFAQVARDLAGLLRDRLVAVLGGARDADGPWSDPRALVQAIDVLAAAEAEMRRSAQPRFVLEVALLRLIAEAWRRAPAPAAGAVPAPPPPPPAAAPAAAAPPEEPGARPPAPLRAGDALARVRARWPEVIAALRPSTREVIRHAEPVRVSGQRLTLRVSDNYDPIVRAKVRELAAALATALGGAWAVEVERGRVAGAPATPELAAELFEGEVIDGRGGAPPAGRPV